MIILRVLRMQLTTAGDFYHANTYDIGPDPEDREMVEYKYTNSTAAGLQFTAAATLNLNQLQVPQGTTQNDRLGRKIRLRQMRFTAFTFVTPQSINWGTGLSEIVRIIWFVDKQCQSNAVALDLLNLDVVYAEYFIGNVDRFTILADHMATLNPVAAGGGGLTAGYLYYEAKYLEWLLDCDIDITYPDASVSPLHNSINVLTISSSGIAKVDWDMAYYYTDC